MRLLFIINTPAQVYTWHHLIQEFLSKDHDVKILARDYGSTVKLINSFGFQCSVFKPVGSRLSRIFGTIDHIRQCYKLARNYFPSIVIGFGLDAAIIASLFRKQCIVFVDDDDSALQNNLTRLLSSAIITPEYFNWKLGKKHIRIKGYKELTYLHPDYFEPDPSIFHELRLAENERYIILRFNIFDAIHDIGKHGFSASDQSSLVQKLSKYAHVFISPEGPLAKELEGYRLSIPYERIHHVLYYAQLLVTDTQTMATEAAVLGTPTIRCNSYVGQVRVGNFIELEQKYDLIYSIRDPKHAIRKAIELIQQPDVKEQWAKKRNNLLSDKINVTKFMIDFIENFPDSFKEYEEKSNIL